MKQITNDLINIGVKDCDVDLFEGQFVVPDGIRYNSYVIRDEKIAVFDTVDRKFTKEWLDGLDKALKGASPDYLIILHMEPDHSANILNLIKKYSEITLVGNSKTFIMLEEFFGDTECNRITVENGETLCLGKHNIKFLFAPMIHWPEVMTAYDDYDYTLFSADAFGTFGDGETVEKWTEEARRYYYGIVGKYGIQVTALLNKLASYKIKRICSLHGPVLSENLEYYLDLYLKWSNYDYEKDSVMIAYTSVYGHTEQAVKLLADELKSRGVKDLAVYDLARADRSLCIAEAFKYAKLVMATTTYNANVFPAMREFINDITERNFQKRKIAVIENGSWSPVAAKIIKSKFENCKGIEFAATEIKIRSSLSKENIEDIKSLSEELSK